MLEDVSQTLRRDEELVQGVLRELVGRRRRKPKEELSRRGQHLLDTFADIKHEVEVLLEEFGSEPGKTFLEDLLLLLGRLSLIARPMFQLLEAAVQLAERLQGPKVGPKKRAFVVEAVCQVTQQLGKSTKIGNLSPLESHLLQSLIGLAVDGLVDVVNERDCWAPESRRYSFWKKLRHWLIARLVTVAAFFAELLHPSTGLKLSPEQMAEIEGAFVEPLKRIEEALREGTGTEPGHVERPIAELRMFTAIVRRLFLIVDLVIDDVEDLVHLSSQEKRTLARDVVIEILSTSLGISLERYPFMKQAVAVMIEIVIDGLVEVLNRRSELRPHKTKSAGAGELPQTADAGAQP